MATVWSRPSPNVAGHCQAAEGEHEVTRPAERTAAQLHCAERGMSCPLAPYDNAHSRAYGQAVGGKWSSAHADVFFMLPTSRQFNAGVRPRKISMTHKIRTLADRTRWTLKFSGHMAGHCVAPLPRPPRSDRGNGQLVRIRPQEHCMDSAETLASLSR